MTVPAEIKRLSDRLRAAKSASPSPLQRMQRTDVFDEVLTPTPKRTRKPRTDLPADAGSDTPLRLDVAAKLAFPGGGVTAASLRREARAGRLVIERIAGKDFTTLTHIETMRREAATCRDGVKVRASGLNQRSATHAGDLSDRQHGSSATERELLSRGRVNRSLGRPGTTAGSQNTQGHHGRRHCDPLSSR